MIDKKTFYQKIRDVKLFDSLTHLQVQCLDILIDEWDKTNIEDLRQFAYLLGTIYHETGFKMIPVTENGSENYLKSKPYYPFIGRGFVQITWKRNYEAFGKILGINLINNPDNALDPFISANIAVIGMTKGKFTGVSLSKYFNSVKEDWLNARRIINGLDKAEVIANYAKRFDACLIEL